jgi:hypothetical protein
MVLVLNRRSPCSYLCSTPASPYCYEDLQIIKREWVCPKLRYSMAGRTVDTARNLKTVG